MAKQKKEQVQTKKTADNFKKETEEKIEVKQLLQDERTHKIAGSIFLLLSLLFFIAFTSYLFTWEEDQDKVFKDGARLLLGTSTPVSNLMGTFGAYVSHFFIYKGFGVASYLLCSFFFVIGVNLFFGRKLFSLARNIKYLIIGLPLLSVTASVIAGNQAFAWGGAVGDLCANYLYSTVGTMGTFGIIGIAFLAYIIWHFNPNFHAAAKKVQSRALSPSADVAATENEVDELNAEEDDTGISGNNLPDDIVLPPASGATLNDLYAKANRAGAETPVLNVPSQSPVFKHDIQITEKEEAIPDFETEEVRLVQIPARPVMVVPPPAEAEPVLPPMGPVVQSSEIDLPLEIKGPEQEVTHEDFKGLTAAEKVLQSKPYDPILDLKDYKYPNVELLENHGSEKIVQDPQELENNKNQIINTLKNYDIQIQKISATVGPTVTLYEIIPAPGVRISRIKNLEDDIALSLAALGIRIIAPIPGKGTIGIEVPNTRKTIVSMKTLLSSEKFSQNKFSLPIAIGKKIDNENFIVDLASMPHLLMAGATGQGKSVGLNAILVSLLYSKHPSQLKFVLVDPKKVELSIYKTIERHFLAKLPGEEDSIITDTKKVVNTLNALCIEMDNRYDLLKEAGCRNIKEYNEKFAARKLSPEKGHQFLPFIVLVVDEFADLIMTAGKEVEMPIARLAQLARAIGIHLIIATQRPSVNIITGTIKANFPARIAFKVSSKIDSRTILDTGGAEQLIGKGDMLINYNGEVVRLQCAFVDTPEVDKIVDFIGGQRGYPDAFLLPEYIDEKEEATRDFDVNNKDSLFEDAARLIVSSQSGSTSLIQRRMKLGYNRAGRIMDQLESAGIVGGSQGSKPRDVLFKTEYELEQFLQGNA